VEVSCDAVTPLNTTSVSSNPTRFFVTIPATKRLTVTVDYDLFVTIYGREYPKEPSTYVSDYQTARSTLAPDISTVTLEPSQEQRRINFMATVHPLIFVTNLAG
jgi:hypothetical protein